MVDEKKLKPLVKIIQQELRGKEHLKGDELRREIFATCNEEISKIIELIYNPNETNCYVKGFIRKIAPDFTHEDVEDAGQIFVVNKLPLIVMNFVEEKKVKFTTFLTQGIINSVIDARRKKAQREGNPLSPEIEISEFKKALKTLEDISKSFELPKSPTRGSKSIGVVSIDDDKTTGKTFDMPDEAVNIEGSFIDEEDRIRDVKIGSLYIKRILSDVLENSRHQPETILVFLCKQLVAIYDVHTTTDIEYIFSHECIDKTFEEFVAVCDVNKDAEYIFLWECVDKIFGTTASFIGEKYKNGLEDSLDVAELLTKRLKKRNALNNVFSQKVRDAFSDIKKTSESGRDYIAQCVYSIRERIKYRDINNEIFNYLRNKSGIKENNK